LNYPTKVVEILSNKVVEISCRGNGRISLEVVEIYVILKIILFSNEKQA
jgi:hypothetical protein